MGNQDPNKRFTSWQIINLSPTLLVDSVAEPISPQQMSQLLIRAMTDIDRKICVEGVKAMRSVVLEALTGYERDLIGSSLVFQAFQVGCWVALVVSNGVGKIRLMVVFERSIPRHWR